jgi:Rieske Fe-S protein
LTELQKDPITRGDFLGFGFIGAVMGAILTIPPVAFILTPVIQKDVLGQSNVGDVWQRVGPVSEVPTDEPKVFVVNFPLTQSYANEQIQEESGVTDKRFTLTNAVWLSWKTEVKPSGKLGKTQRPAFLDQKQEGFSQSEREELLNSLNVLSNSCAHLGCPVRWLIVEGKGEFLCPCHGGLYDINGDYVGGPPPRGMYRYAQTEVREDGNLYIKHGYELEDRLDAQQPYVV